MKKMMKKVGAGRLFLPLLLCLCAALALLPVMAGAAGNYETTELANFTVYEFDGGTTADPWIIDNTIDLSTLVHFSFSGPLNSFALLPVTGEETPDGSEISSGLERVYADEVLELNYASYYSSTADTAYVGDGTYVFENSQWSAGMSLQYQAGDTDLYVEPGRYRFLVRDGRGTELRYSDVFTITDNEDLTASQGTVDAKFYDGKTEQGAYTANGSDGDTLSYLLSDGEFYLHLSGFAPAINGKAEKISLIGCDEGSRFSDEYQLWPSNLTTSDNSEGSLLDKNENNVQILEGFELNCNGYSTFVRDVLNPGSYRVLVSVDGKNYIDNTVIEIGYESQPDAPDITTPAALPGATTSEAYSVTLQADAEGVVTWSLTEGSLPGGLELNGTTGEISGTPTVIGSYTFTLEAAQAGGGTDSRQFTLVISGPMINIEQPASFGAGDEIAHIGWFSVYGLKEDDSRVYVYSGAGLPGTLSVESAKLGGCTAVELRGSVGGADVRLAGANFSALDGSSGGTIELEDQSADLTLKRISKLEVKDQDGEILPAEAYTYQLQRQGDGYVALPAYLLAGKYSVRLSPNYNYDGWQEYDFNRSYSVKVDENAASTLSVEINKHAATRRVSGTVTSGSQSIPGAVITVSQTVNGLTHNLTAVSDDNGEYLLAIYPNIEAKLQLSWLGKRYDSETIDGGEDDVTQDFTFEPSYQNAALELRFSLKAAEDYDDDAATSRYIRALSGDISFAADLSAGSATCVTSATGSLADGGGVVRLSLEVLAGKNIAQGSSPTANLSWSGRAVADGALDDISLGDSLLAQAQPQLTPRGGVLLSVGSDVSRSACALWFDGSGALASRDYFSVSQAQSDVALPAPGVGTYTLALCANDAAISAITNLNGLSSDSYRARFEDLSISDGVGVDKGDLDFTGETTDNEKYLTQPNSALSGPQSFSSNQELLLFSGSVGLDDNISGGSLRELMLNVENLSLLYAVIDGERYDISTSGGSHSIDFYNAPLPLNLSIYARALDADADARLTVTAIISADGFDDPPVQPVFCVFLSCFRLLHYPPVLPQPPHISVAEDLAVPEPGPGQGEGQDDAAEGLEPGDGIREEREVSHGSVAGQAKEDDDQQAGYAGETVTVLGQITAQGLQRPVADVPDVSFGAAHVLGDLPDRLVVDHAAEQHLSL